MSVEAKPLILKDELAKFARHANPASWLKDANDTIEGWRVGMPGVARLKLVSELDQERLELRCDDGWGVNGFAVYTIDQAGLTFRSQLNEQERLPNTNLVTEQQFIAHLLKVLSSKLAPLDKRTR